MTPADPERVRSRLEAWQPRDPHEGSGIAAWGCGFLIGALWAMAICACVWWGRHRG